MKERQPKGGQIGSFNKLGFMARYIIGWDGVWVHVTYIYYYDIMGHTIEFISTLKHWDSIVDEQYLPNHNIEHQVCK